MDGQEVASGSGREDKRDEPSINESNLMSRFQIGKLVLNNKKFSHFGRVIVVYCESNPANSTTESARNKEHAPHLTII